MRSLSITIKNMESDHEKSSEKLKRFKNPDKGTLKLILVVLIYK